MRGQRRRDTGGARPVLTAAGERLLRRLALRRRAVEDAALPVAPRRLLIVKVHGFGDAVMVRSMAEHLQQCYPGIEIDILAGAANRELFALGGGFSVHLYCQSGLNARSAFALWRELRRRQYDAMLNFEQGSLAGTAFLSSTGVPVRVGFLPLRDDSKNIFLTHGVRLGEDESMWGLFGRLARIVGPNLPEELQTVPLPLGVDARRWAEARICEQTAGRPPRLVAFHLGSQMSRPMKRWPIERFAAVAEALRTLVPEMAVVLTGLAYERPLLEGFRAAYRGATIDGLETGSLERTAALLSLCDLFVGNDTGATHLSAAMGIPTVAIFGPTAPRQWTPVGPRIVSVSGPGLSCSPCIDTYRLLDPGDCANPDRLRCLRDVGVEQVVEAARRAVAGSWLG